MDLDICHFQKVSTDKSADVMPRKLRNGSELRRLHRHPIMPLIDTSNNGTERTTQPVQNALRFSISRGSYGSAIYTWLSIGGRYTGILHYFIFRSAMPFAEYVAACFRFFSIYARRPASCKTMGKRCAYFCGISRF